MQQTDLFYSMLTVNETLEMAAELALPDALPRQDKQQYVGHLTQVSDRLLHVTVLLFTARILRKASKAFVTYSSTALSALMMYAAKASSYEVFKIIVPSG